MAYTKQNFENGKVLTAEQLNRMDAELYEVSQKVENVGTAETDPTVPNWAKQPEKPSYTAQEVGALPDTYTPPTQTAEQVGADPSGTAERVVSEHNTDEDSHNDIRLALEAINDRLTAFFDSDEQTLDELSEIVAYITSNKSLIDAITTSKVSVLDIVDNLTTNVVNKPLSAAQGVVLKGLIDALTASLSGYQPKGDYALSSAIPTKVSQLANDKGYLTEHQDISGKLDASALPTAVNDALAQAKASGEFDGDPGKDGTSPVVSVAAITGGHRITITDANDTKTVDVMDGNDGAAGQRGTGILYITTAPASYTTTTGGFTPVYRIALSTVLTQSKAEKVLVGDTLAYNYYHYPVGYVDASYVYLGTRKSIRGATGAAGADGKDYVLTEADKAEIVALMIESLGGNPVFGYVDADTMTVVLKNAPDGEYSLAYLKDDGTISAPIGSMVKDTNVYYTVTNNLTQCTNSNSATQVVEGSSYSATITAKSGYELKSVTVTMGGSPVTVSGGNISITNVTGNIVITAVAEVSGPAYTNRIPLSKDASGNAFNGGQGWKTGYRLGGDGTEKAQSGIEVTGFIPIVYGDTIYMKNITDDGTHVMGVYNSSHAKIGTRIFTNIFGGAVSGQVLSMVVDNEWATETSSTSGVAYLRVSANEITADSIITVNEPIV